MTKMLNKISVRWHRLNPTLIYLITFSMYLVSVTIHTTTFDVYYPHFVESIIQLLTVIVMLGKIVFFDELTSKQIIGELSLLGLVVIVALISVNNFLITTVLLIMAARNVDFRTIVKCYLWIVGGIMFAAFVASETGIIQNITYPVPDGLRQSFGILYTTDFAAHIFYLCCAYLYVRAESFRLIDYLPVFVALGIIYFFTRTMTDVIALAVLIILFTLYIYRRKLRKSWLVRTILRYSFTAMPIIAMLILQLSAGFNWNNSVYLKLNSFLSNRLSFGSDAIFVYGFKLLGQAPIYINGWGGVRSSALSKGAGDLTYFYIDSSYLNSLIAYGILLTLVIVIGTSIFLYCRTRSNDYLLPVIIVAISIASAFDQHLLTVSYNVFLLMYFSDLPHYSLKVGSSFKKSILKN